jgi:hypothetical protein
LDADRAPQLKRGVRLLSRPVDHKSKTPILNCAAVVLLCFALTHLAFAQTSNSLKRERKPEIATIESYVREVDRFIKNNPQSQRIFANVASGADEIPDEWRAFKSEKERAEADTGDNLNDNAYVWLRGEKVVGVDFTFQSPSRDWAHFVMYYYRPDGTLAKIDARLNTFHGNITVIREEVLQWQR